MPSCSFRCHFFDTKRSTCVCVCVTLSLRVSVCNSLCVYYIVVSVVRTFIARYLCFRGEIQSFPSCAAPCTCVVLPNKHLIKVVLCCQSAFEGHELVQIRMRSCFLVGGVHQKLGDGILTLSWLEVSVGLWSRNNHFMQASHCRAQWKSTTSISYPLMEG